ncbi:MAG: hypothetical protein K8S54_09620 [Spirochaetia bacterium]|nr:hypothetical protein [Spirochaetia bacterium]
MKDRVCALMLSRSYGEAFRLCDQVVRAAKKRDKFFHLAGAVSLLGLGHVRQAEEWTEQAEFTDPEFFYVDALIHLHAGRSSEALLCYTRVINADPSDTFADKLIERLRAEPEELQHEVSESPIERYLPLRSWFSDQGRARQSEGQPIAIDFGDRFKVVQSFFSGRVVRYAGMVLGLAVVLTAAVFLYFRFMRGPLADLAEKLPEPPAQGTIIPMSELKNVEVRIQFENRKDVVDQYSLARQKILEGRVNEGRVLLNEIEYSNAGFEIKERSSLLKQMIPYIPGKAFQDNVEIQKVIDDPALYQGVQVDWPGTIEMDPGPILVTAGGKARLAGSLPTELKQGSAVRVSAFFDRMAGGLPVLLVRELQ